MKNNQYFPNKKKEKKILEAPLFLLSNLNYSQKPVSYFKIFYSALLCLEPGGKVRSVTGLGNNLDPLLNTFQVSPTAAAKSPDVELRLLLMRKSTKFHFLLLIKSKCRKQ